MWIWLCVTMEFGLLCFEGTLILVVKVVQFAWTFWRISGAPHLRWRQPCSLCRHCCLLLNLMILKMLSWHNRYCQLYLECMDVRSFCLWMLVLKTSTLDCIKKDFNNMYCCSILETTRLLLAQLDIGQKLLPRRHLLGWKKRLKP